MTEPGDDAVLSGALLRSHGITRVKPTFLESADLCSIVFTVDANPDGLVPGKYVLGARLNEFGAPVEPRPVRHPSVRHLPDLPAYLAQMVVEHVAANMIATQIALLDYEFGPSNGGS